MIWIKENDELVGYVPVLKKVYTDDEIREMSNHSFLQPREWSKLSSLVMHIQGISYIDYDEHTMIRLTFDAPLRLYQIEHEFNYECLLPLDNSSLIPYIKQVFDVFENLTLYKVENYSISNLEKEFKEKLDYISHFIDTESINISLIYLNFQHTLSIAEQNSSNIQKLFEIFSSNGLILSHNLFEEADEEIISQLKQRRQGRPIRLIK